MENTEKYNSFVGKTLDNRYKVLEVVGVGGMAVVLKAQDTVMNRTVAIKVLNDEYNRDESAVQRFVNESKAVAMLSHPNIVNIFDVAFGSNMKYIVMEYIDGKSLDEYMRAKGKMTWKDAVYITDQILLALEHAHEKGIVHRDVKPQNIMILRNGSVKVADFGIATLPNIENIPSQNKAIGTVYYMSPEQACGQTTDFATDLYSLGVMMYEMTTGVLPFDGENTNEIASKQVNEMPRDPRSIEITIPRGLEQIILRAMEKDPKARYGSAHNMRRMIQILRNNPSIVFADGSNRPGNTDSVHTTEQGDKKSATQTFSKVIPATIPISNIPVNRNEKPSGDTQHVDAVDAGKKNSRKTDPVKQGTGENKKVIKNNTDNKNSNKRPVGKNTMFPIILGVALAFLVVVVVGGAVLAASIFENSTGVGTIYEIPEYIGMEYGEELKNKIIADNLVLKDVKYEYDLESSKDYVVAQNPAPNSKRKTRDLILTVSLGSRTVIMQDLTMCIYTKAEVYLNNMGLKPVIKKVNDPSVMENYIIKTEPAPGDTVTVGDEIILYVSMGDDTEFYLMPDFVGSTDEETQRILTENNIVNVEKVIRKSDRPTGEILEQNIAPDTNIPKKTAKLILVVSEYDESLDPNVPPADLPVSVIPPEEPVEGDTQPEEPVEGDNRPEEPVEGDTQPEEAVSDTPAGIQNPEASELQPVEPQLPEHVPENTQIAGEQTEI